MSDFESVPDPAPPRRKRVVSWTGRLLVALVALGLGFGAGWLVAHEPALDEVDAPPATETYPVQASEFADIRQVSLQVSREPSRVASIPDVGTVTALDCQPGQTLVTGDAPLTIDDRPRIALASDVPFFRDLTGGERGNDVDALRRLLTEEGFPLAEGGTFDRPARAALRDFAAEKGVRPREGVAFARKDFLWLPGEFAVASCAVDVGDQVTPGEPLATSGGGVAALEFKLPVDASPGPREVRVGDVGTHVGEGRRITDPETLRALVETPEARLALDAADGQTATIPALVQLAEPLTAYALPPSALMDVARSEARVCDGREKGKVTILGSSLGLTHVAFDAEPLSEVILRPREVEACR